MLCLLLLASAPPLADEARRAIEWQLRSPPRPDSAAGLSAEEAAMVRQRYLDSIGQRPPQPSSEERTGAP